MIGNLIGQTENYCLFQGRGELMRREKEWLGDEMAINKASSI